MEGWKCEVLSDVIHLINGGTPSTTNENYWNGEIPWLSVDDFNTGKRFVYDAAKKISKLGLENSATKLLDVGDIIISARGTVGVIAQLASKMAFNQSCYGIKQKLDDLSIDYIYYYLCYYFWAIGVVKTGSTFDTITKKTFDEISISFPTTRIEQHKITTILSTIDSSIVQTEQLIAKYKKIKQGLMHDLLTYGIDQNGTIRNPQTHTFVGKNGMMVPEEWAVKTLERCAKINGRVGWKGYIVSDLRDFGALTLGAMHIDKANKLDLSNSVYLSHEKFVESPEIMVKKGDVLVVQRGSIGKVVCIDKEIGEATINPSMILLNNFTISSKYVYYFLISKEGQKQIEFSTSQTGVPMISQIQVKNFNIPIPAPIEQQKIVSILDQQESLIESEQTNLAKLQKLKQGLMQDLLTGKVRVKADILI